MVSKDFNMDGYAELEAADNLLKKRFQNGSYWEKDVLAKMKEAAKMRKEEQKLRGPVRRYDDTMIPGGSRGKR